MFVFRAENHKIKNIIRLFIQIFIYFLFHLVKGREFNFLPVTL